MVKRSDRQVSTNIGEGRVVQMRIGICDSTMQKVEAVERFLKYNMELDEMEFKQYLPEEASMDIEESIFSCDIFITEIVFDNLNYNGILLAKEINRAFPSCKIIFYVDHIPSELDIYDVEHCNCVLKKDRDKRLIHAIHSAIMRLDQNHKNYVRVSYGKIVHVFSSNDVVCIRKENCLTKYYTIKDTYAQYKPLSEAIKELPETFVRVNSNCIVNRRHIRRYSRNEVTLDSGETVKIGRAYKENFFG